MELLVDVLLVTDLLPVTLSVKQKEWPQIPLPLRNNLLLTTAHTTTWYNSIHKAEAPREQAKCFAAMYSMFNSSGYLCHQVPYGKPRMLQTSSTYTPIYDLTHTFTFLSVWLDEGQHECLKSSAKSLVTLIYLNTIQWSELSAWCHQKQFSSISHISEAVFKG